MSISDTGGVEAQQPVYKFSEETLKLKDLAGRKFRLVTEDNNSITIKADSSIYKMFHGKKAKEHYATREDIKSILSNIPKGDEKSKGIAKLFLKEFTLHTKADKQELAGTFINCFKELYANDPPFDALNRLFDKEHPALDDQGFYDFLSRAGALEGNGQNLKNYIRECLLSGDTVSDADLGLFKEEGNDIGKALLNKIAEETFQTLKKEAAGLPKSRLFEYTDKVEKLGQIPKHEKFDKLREWGWIRTQKSPDKAKFDAFLDQCRTLMRNLDADLDTYRADPTRDPYGEMSKSARNEKAAIRDLLYPDQKLTDIEENVCISARLTSTDANLTLNLIKEQKIKITEKFIGTLLDNVQDADKKKALQEGIEDIHASRNRKYQSLAKEVADAVNKMPESQDPVTRSLRLNKQLEKMDKVGADKYSLLRLALPQIHNETIKTTLKALATEAWKNDYEPRVY